jgi:hypothetical protein
VPALPVLGGWPSLSVLPQAVTTRANDNNPTQCGKALKVALA